MTDIAEVWLWTVEVVPNGPGAMPDISGYDVSARARHRAGRGGRERGRRALLCRCRHGLLDLREEAHDPGRQIGTIDHDNHRINAKLTKDDVRHAPDYDRERRDESDVRRAYEEHERAGSTANR